MSKIRIRAGVFLISDPFQAGHPLTQREADALNGLRAENIRNNLAKEFGRLPRPLSDSALDEFARRVAEYDGSYEFYGSTSRPPRAGAFEQEVRKLAEALAKKVGEPVEDLMNLRSLQDEARRRLEVQRQVSERALEDLGLQGGDDEL